MIIKVQTILNKAKKTTDSIKKSETFQEIIDDIGTAAKMIIELTRIALNRSKMTQNQVN